MRTTLLVLMLLSCRGNAVQQNDRDACSPSGVLEIIGHVVETGDLRALARVSATARQFPRGARVTSRNESAEFDRVTRESLERSVLAWRTRIGEAQFAEYRVGTKREATELADVTPPLDTIEGSVLIFSTASGERITVPVEFLLKLGGCWRVVEVSEPFQEVTTEHARPQTAKPCLSSRDLLRALAGVLVDPTKSIDPLLLSDEDVLSLMTSPEPEAARQFAETIRFDTVGDVQKWSQLIAESEVLDVHAGEEGIITAWSAPVSTVTATTGEIILKNRAGRLLKIPIKELVQVKGCWKITWVGQPQEEK